MALKRRLHTDADSDFAALLVLSGGVSLKRHDRAGAETQLLEAWKILETASARVDPKLRLGVSELLARLYGDWSKNDPAKAAAAAEWEKRKQAFGEDKATQGASLQTAANPPTNPYAHYDNTKTADSATLRTRGSRPSSAPRPFFDFQGHVLMVQVEKIGRCLQRLAQAPSALGGKYHPECVQDEAGFTIRLSFLCRSGKTLGAKLKSSRVTGATRSLRKRASKSNCKREDLQSDRKESRDDFDVMLWDETQGIDNPPLLKTWRLTGRRADLFKHSPTEDSCALPCENEPNPKRVFSVAPLTIGSRNCGRQVYRLTVRPRVRVGQSGRRAERQGCERQRRSAFPAAWRREKAPYGEFLTGVIPGGWNLRMKE